jgi:prolyl-tRNA synthetase
VFVGRRDRGVKDKAGIGRAEFVANIAATLDEIQQTLHGRALAFRKEHTRIIDTKDEFYAFFAEPKRQKDNDPTPIHGGFAMAHFSGDPKLEAQIKDDLGVTVRCIPLAHPQGADPQGEAGEPGTCPFTGQPSKQRVVWAKSY